MADTPDLLQTLRRSFNNDKRPNYQVLVPNMKGLDNLIALEQKVKDAGLGRLTDEIALFVPASDVGFSMSVPLVSRVRLALMRSELMYRASVKPIMAPLSTNC